MRFDHIGKQQAPRTASASAKKVTDVRKRNTTQWPAAGGKFFQKVVGKQKLNCIRRDRQRPGWSDLT